MDCFLCSQVRDLCIAYMLVTLTYLYIGALVFASFPSPPLSKDCIEQVSHYVSSLCDCSYVPKCVASRILFECISTPSFSTAELLYLGAQIAFCGHNTCLKQSTVEYTVLLITNYFNRIMLIVKRSGTELLLL